MRRVGSGRDLEGQLAYHLAATYAADFTAEHPHRIALAHKELDRIIAIEKRPLTIIELGCGAGDISGPYSKEHAVIGVDVASPAFAEVARRWPNMGYFDSPIEQLRPRSCDVIILAEVLEHLVEPERIVFGWLPEAEWSIIGHPLNEPDPPHEPGHIWSFDIADYHYWYQLGGHEPVAETRYPLGNWPEAIIGTGRRR